MEESTITFLSGKEEYEKSRKYIAKSEDEQRFLYYAKRIGSFTTYNVKETETHVYWSEATYTPRFNNKLFYSIKGISGITLEKKTNKASIWFGKRPCSVLIQSFYSYHNCNFVNELPQLFSSYFTVSLIKDVARGKVNSIEDYALHLSKKSLMFKGIDSKILANLIYTFKLYKDIYYYQSLDFISSFLNLSKYPEKAIEYLSSNDSLYGLESTVVRAVSLNEQIDIYDSKSRESEGLRITELYEKAMDKYIEDKSDLILPF